MNKLAPYEPMLKAINLIPKIFLSVKDNVEATPQSFMRIANRLENWILYRRGLIGLLSTSHHIQHKTGFIYQLFGVKRIDYGRDDLHLKTNHCYCCGSTAALQADHIVPLCFGGNNSNENAQVLCLSCHYEKGLNIVQFEKDPKDYFVDFNAVPRDMIVYGESTLFGENDIELLKQHLPFNVRGIDEPVTYFQNVALSSSPYTMIDYPTSAQIKPEVLDEIKIEWLKLFDDLVGFEITDSDRYDMFLNRIFTDDNAGYTIDEIRGLALDMLKRRHRGGAG